MKHAPFILLLAILIALTVMIGLLVRRVSSPVPVNVHITQEPAQIEVKVLMPEPLPEAVDTLERIVDDEMGFVCYYLPRSGAVSCGPIWYGVIPPEVREWIPPGDGPSRE